MIMNDWNYRLLHETSIRLKLCSRFCSLLYIFYSTFVKILGKSWVIHGVWIINEFIVDRSEIEFEVEIHVTEGYELRLQANDIAKVVRNVKLITMVLRLSSFFGIWLLGSFLAS